jgi:hypothetical protein
MPLNVLFSICAYHRRPGDSIEGECGRTYKKSAEVFSRRVQTFTVFRTENLRFSILLRRERFLYGFPFTKGPIPCTRAWIKRSGFGFLSVCGFGWFGFRFVVAVNPEIVGIPYTLPGLQPGPICARVVLRVSRNGMPA